MESTIAPPVSLPLERRELRAAVRGWLLGFCVLLLAMVALGGVTRLTQSGLSIVEWKPLIGAIPPLDEAQWEREFALYQQFPQYKLVNAGMTLGEFKRIYFWEYLHRLVGRLIGVAFVLPRVLLAALGGLSGRLHRRLAVIFSLGIAQGFMGWLMVKSGLVDYPQVSHYRLAAHLSLALLVLSACFWLWLDLRAEARGERTWPAARPLRNATGVLLALTGLQVTYGAFTAGLRAGLWFDTFPTMGGEWIPRGMFLPPNPLGFMENPVAVQFIHRVIAWLLAFGVLALWWRLRRAEVPAAIRLRAHLLLAAVSVQFTLGILTVLYRVPVSLGTLHQLGGCLMLLAALGLLHGLRAAPAPVSASNA